MTPNYNMMLDSYISKCKTTYEEYKQLLILLITYTSINNKGRLVYYEGNLIKELEEKRKAFDEAMERLNNFKELNSEINTLGRNINGTIYVTSDYGKSYLKLFNNLFQSLDIGEEIIIDDYVERRKKQDD